MSTRIPNETGAMTVARSRTFKSGKSEAVRLPKEVAFGEGVELVIVRSGDVMTATEMVSRLHALPVPPEIETREIEPLPERDAL